MIQAGRERLYNLLRWSEKYTKTDMVYLAQGGFWLTFGQSVAAILSLISAVLFANLLAQDTYGIYKYLLSIAGIIGAFSLTGAATAIVTATARGINGALRQEVRHSWKWSILTAVIFFLAAFYYWMRGNDTLALGMIVGMASTPLINTWGLYSSYFNGIRDFAAHTRYRIVRDSIPLLAVLAGLFVTDDPVLLAAIFLGTSALVLGLQYVQVLRIYRPEGPFDAETGVYARKLSFLNTLTTIVVYIDKVLVFQFLGAAELAVYFFSVAVPDQLKNFISQLSTLALPKFATQPQNTPYPLLRKTAALFGLILCASGAYVVAAPYIYTWIFPQYIQSISFSQLYMLSIPSVAGIIPLTLLKARQEAAALHRYTIFSSITQIVALVVLTYTAGIWGAVIARVVTRYINFAYALILARKKLP